MHICVAEDSAVCYCAAWSRRDSSLVTNTNVLLVLAGSTDTLLGEKQALLEFAEALRARLKFFDEYELAANQFAAAAAAPDSAELMPLLNRLDDCIAYVAANPQYADAVAYATKFRQLHSRALGLVKGRVQTVLRQAAQTVQAAVSEAATAQNAAAGQQGLPSRAASVQLQPALSRSGSLSRAIVLPEGLEVSLLYVRFRAAAEPVLKGRQVPDMDMRRATVLADCIASKFYAALIQDGVSSLPGDAESSSYRVVVPHISISLLTFM